MTIKQSPSDFKVEERLYSTYLASLSEVPAPFVLYRLTKVSLSTPEALREVARALGVHSTHVEAAGLKDKHAQTIQHLTVKPFKGPGKDLPRLASGQGWSIERLGWVGQPITAEAIERNEFDILMRDLSPQDCALMDRVVDFLAAPSTPRPADGATPSPQRDPTAAVPNGGQAVGRSLLFTNYFGDQRFGSARHGKGFIARHLVRGEFEEGLRLMIATPARKDRQEEKRLKKAIQAGWGRWEELLKQFPRRKRPELVALERLKHSNGDFRAAFRALPYFEQQMAVYAYQSHLWNRIATGLLSALGGQTELLEAEDPFGALWFTRATDIPPSLRHLQLPILGATTKLVDPWEAVAKKVLEEEGLSGRRLEIPGLRRPFFGEAPRTLFVEAAGFEVASPAAEVSGPAGAPHGAAQAGLGVGPSRSKAVKTRTRRLRFALPRGAYATVLLRALGQ